MWPPKLRTKKSGFSGTRQAITGRLSPRSEYSSEKALLLSRKNPLTVSVQTLRFCQTTYVRLILPLCVQRPTTLKLVIPSLLKSKQSTNMGSLRNLVLGMVLCAHKDQSNRVRLILSTQVPISSYRGLNRLMKEAQSLPSRFCFKKRIVYSQKRQLTATEVIQRW